jgi:hypothetical protein
MCLSEQCLYMGACNFSVESLLFEATAIQPSILGGSAWKARFRSALEPRRP